MPIGQILTHIFVIFIRFAQQIDGLFTWFARFTRFTVGCNSICLIRSIQFALICSIHSASFPDLHIIYIKRLFHEQLSKTFWLKKGSMLTEKWLVWFGFFQSGYQGMLISSVWLSNHADTKLWNPDFGNLVIKLPLWFSSLKNQLKLNLKRLLPNIFQVTSFTSWSNPPPQPPPSPPSPNHF